MNSLSTQPHRKAVFLGTGSIGKVAAIVVAAALGGCAAIAPQGPEEAVRARAQERWSLLVKGELLKGYEYYSPGSRLGFSGEDFVSSIRRGFWKGATVDKVTCGSADTCEVEVTVEHEFKGIKGATPLRETWVRDGRQWWYLRK